MIAMLVILLALAAAATLLFVVMHADLHPKSGSPTETHIHQWQPDYDQNDADRTYDDGLTAYTDQYICTTCGKKQRGKKYVI